MRLILLYAAQVAFIIAGFAAVSSVFVSINSDAMSSAVTQLLSSTANVATAQVVAPLDKFAVQVQAWADILLTNPQLQCAYPWSPEWNFEDPVAAASKSYLPNPKYVNSPGKDVKLAFLRNNLLAEYVYETFQMVDNATQLTECGAGRVGTDIDKGYSYFSPSMHHGGVTTSPDLINCNMNLTADGHGRMTTAVVDSDWYCTQAIDLNAVYHDYELAARALTRNDSALGKWTIFAMNYDPVLLTTTQLMTFGVPLNFSIPDPVTGAYHCTNAATVDLNAQYLTDALHAERIDGVELALFWDSGESLIAWTLGQPSSDPDTGALLYAGATDSPFDQAVEVFHDAGWCSSAVMDTGRLRSCAAPSETSSASNGRYVFVLRRIVHINARFTLVISGDHDTFFGPGERARTVGIAVSVAVCAVCLATSVLLWLTTVRPLRRLIGNMELASTFSSDVDAEGDSCITEVNEANVAFLSMNEQLQIAKPFMPQHLLEHFDAARRDYDGDEDTDPVTDQKSISLSFQRHKRGQSDSKSIASTTRHSSSSQGGDLMLEQRFVAVLVVNITAFDGILRRTSASELLLHYAAFIDAIVRAAKANKGVVDTVQGDHVIVSFNSSLKCVSPAAKAVQTAFSIRAALTTLPEPWQQVTCGIAVGHASCGTVGSNGTKSHATLGSVVRHAVGLQRIARALHDTARETSGGENPANAPWCATTARTIADCAQFAHFKYDAVAALPPSGRLTLIGSLSPLTGDGMLSDQPGAQNSAVSEWLYDVANTAYTNPHREHNQRALERFRNITNVSRDEVAALPGTDYSRKVVEHLTLVTAPQLWCL